MTNTTHVQRRIQGREEGNVESEELHQDLQTISQSEDLESLTMSEVSSTTFQ